MTITASCPYALSNLQSLFNNPTDSDCQIFFPQQKKKLYLHKLILKANSDFFKACFESNMTESREGVIKIEEEDDTLMTELVRSFYTGQIKIPSKDKVASMIVLAQKYQIIAAVPILLKVLMKHLDGNNFMQCIKLDWENELFKEVKEKVRRTFVMNSDKILNGDSYLNLSIEEWMTVLNLIVHSGNYSSAFIAVHDWIQVDEASRAQYSFALMSAVRKSSKLLRPEEDRSTTMVSFQPAFCGSKTTLSNSNRRIRKDSSNLWDCSALGTKCDHFSIRLLNNCQNLMVGMAPQGIKCTHLMVGMALRGINKEGYNYSTCGWYLDCGFGSLYSQSGDSDKAYAQKCSDNGTVITATLKDGCLSFSVNGVDKGVAFRGLPDNLFPAFDIHGSQCEFEFC